MIHIALCDDSRAWLNREREFIKRIDDDSLKFDLFSNGDELIEVYERYGCKYDALFLDIEMKGLSGIKAAKIIREVDREVIIVFMTAYEQYMRECFECMPYGFLIKPVTYTDFKKTVCRIQEMLESDRKTINFRADNDVKRMLYSELLFIESVGHDIIIVDKYGKSYRTHSYSLKGIEAALQDERFVRVSKSNIINVAFLRETIDGCKFVKLRGYSHSIPVNAPYRKELRNRALSFEERRNL